MAAEEREGKAEAEAEEREGEAATRRRHYECCKLISVGLCHLPSALSYSSSSCSPRRSPLEKTRAELSSRQGGRGPRGVGVGTGQMRKNNYALIAMISPGKRNETSSARANEN